MTSELINPLLLLLVLTASCFVVCVRQSPRFLRRLATYALTRADVVDSARKQQRERRLYWSNKLLATPEPSRQVGTLEGPQPPIGRRHRPSRVAPLLPLYAASFGAVEGATSQDGPVAGNAAPASMRGNPTRPVPETHQVVAQIERLQQTAFPPQPNGRQKRQSKRLNE